jgi:hypothetical protein
VIQYTLVNEEAPGVARTSTSVANKIVSLVQKVLHVLFAHPRLREVVAQKAKLAEDDRREHFFSLYADTGRGSPALAMPPARPCKNSAQHVEQVLAPQTCAHPHQGGYKCHSVHAPRSKT